MSSLRTFTVYEVFSHYEYSFPFFWAGAWWSHPPALAEILIFTIGVRYILALAPSAKSTDSGCADNCQSVMAFGNAVLDHSLSGINICSLPLIACGFEIWLILSFSILRRLS